MHIEGQCLFVRQVEKLLKPVLFKSVFTYIHNSIDSVGNLYNETIDLHT